jgi:RNA polymerase sigma factor (sigma-70 family)
MNVLSDTRVQGGPSPVAWDTLIREHRSRVLRHANRLTGDLQEAEDLTQEVFSRAFQKLVAADPVSVGAWLHRVTTNLFIDSVRRRQRRPQVPLSTSVAERLVDVELRPDEVLDARTFDEDVEAALAGLNPSNRAAVMLCDVEGLSYVEVASKLCIKLGTARSQIHRGRAQLRVALAHRSVGDHRIGSIKAAPDLV